MPAEAPLAGLSVAILTPDPAASDCRTASHAAALRQAGCRVQVFSLAGAGGSAGARFVPPMLAWCLQYECAAASLHRALVCAAPDLIHAHGPQTLFVALRAAERTGARVIYDIREPASRGSALTAWRRWQEQRSLRRVSATIAARPAIAFGLGHAQPTIVPDAPAHSHSLIEVYDAVANGPRGLPVAMAQRALATNLRPVGAFATGA